MQPQQSYSQPAGPERFDFIMNAGTKPGLRLPGSTSSNRLVITLIGSLVLLLVFWVVLSIVRSGPHADNKQLLSIGQIQTELARVSQESIDLAAQQPTRNFAQTAQLTLLSEQLLFKTYMTNHGAKVSKTQLIALYNQNTDALLKTARTNGDVDETYKTYAVSQLTEYERQLAQTYKTAQLKSEKTLLQNAFNEAQLLVELSKQQ